MQFISCRICNQKLPICFHQPKKPYFPIESMASHLLSLHTYQYQNPIFTHPFKPVAATPSTKYFWRIRNTTNTGIRDNTEPAMIRP